MRLKIRSPEDFWAGTIFIMMGIGIYSVNNNPADVYLMAFLGFVGYVFVKCRRNFPPLILAMVLGPLMQENPRRLAYLARRSRGVLHTADQPRLHDYDRNSSGAVHRADVQKKKRQRMFMGD